MSGYTCKYQTFFDPSGRKTTGCFSLSGPACKKNEIKQQANKKGPAWNKKERAGPTLVPKTLLYIPEISSSILPCLLIMFRVSRSSVFRILHGKLCKICKVCKIRKHLVYHFKDKDMGICLSLTFLDCCCPSQERRWSARQLDLRRLHYAL